MKRLALVLGSLVVVAASVSAKEVVAAPVVKVEPVVVVAPVKAPVAAPVAFRPTGSVYANSELSGSSFDPTLSFSDSSNKFFGRDVETNLGAKINHMPNHTMSIWGKNINGLEAGSDVENKVGLGYTYKHGMFSNNVAAEFETIVQSVKYTPSFEWNGFSVTPSYKYTWGNGADHFDDDGMLDGGARFYSNEAGLKLGYNYKGFAITPEYKYTQKATAPNDNTNVASLTVEYDYNLPWGLTPHFLVKAEDTMNKNAKDDILVKAEVNVNKEFDLMKNDATTLAFNVKPWYAGTLYDNSPNASALNNSFRKHEVALNLGLSAMHKFSPNFKMDASLGADYVNEVTEEYKMQDWKVKPTAKVGFTASF